jgi:hypothetical protein
LLPVLFCAYASTPVAASAATSTADAAIATTFMLSFAVLLSFGIEPEQPLYFY